MNVIIQGEDPAVLDLVAHFLGVATHDNINAAPTAWAPRNKVAQSESLGPAVTGTCGASFGGWPSGMRLVLTQEDDFLFAGMVSSA